MQQDLKYSLIFLTWNEIDGLRGIFDKIPLDEFDEVFAVDGGSTDGTLEFYTEHGVRVVPQESQGRGEAFRIAIQQARGDVLIFYSPDGNEDPKDLPKFKQYFESGNDIVIASRMMKGAHNEEDDLWFKWRKWANNVFNWLANTFFNDSGKYITDSINGFRGIKKEAWEVIKPDGSGYTIEYQMTIRAMKAKLKVEEFPTHEYPRIGGESYAKSIPTGIAFLKLLYRELFHTNFLKKIDLFIIAALASLALWAILALFSLQNVTSHPEYHRWIARATTNGVSLQRVDFLRGFDPMSFDGWIRPRFTNYLVTVLNIKFRLFLYNYFIPFTTLSLHFVITLILAPILFYKTAKILLRSKLQAFYAVCLYITSVGFLSSLVTLFQPAKALVQVAVLLLYYLLAKVSQSGNGLLDKKSLKYLIPILILNFIGISIDEGYLVMALIAIILFYQLFLPAKIVQLEIFLARAGVYLVPFLFFLFFTVFAAPSISKYIGVGEVDYVGWVLLKSNEVEKAPLLPLVGKMSESLLATSFTPLLYAGDKVPIMLKSVWQNQNVLIYSLLVLILVAVSFVRFIDLKKKRFSFQESFCSVGNNYPSKLITYALAIGAFIFLQSLLMRFHPVISGAYFYSSLFSLLSVMFLALLLSPSRSAWQNTVGKLLLVAFAVIQLTNFYDLNHRWYLFHTNWIHLESNVAFPAMGISDPITRDSDWLKKAGLLDRQVFAKPGFTPMERRNIWKKWKNGKEVDFSQMDNYNEKDALFMHELTALQGSSSTQK